MYRSLLGKAAERLFNVLRYDEYDFEYIPNKIHYSKKLDLYYVLAIYNDTFAITFDEEGRISFYSVLDKTYLKNLIDDGDTYLLASFIFNDEKRLPAVQNIISYLINETIKYTELDISYTRFIINKKLCSWNILDNYFNIPFKKIRLKKYEDELVTSIKNNNEKLLLKLGFDAAKITTKWANNLNYITYTTTKPISLIINKNMEIQFCYTTTALDVKEKYYHIATIKYRKDYDNLIIALLEKCKEDVNKTYEEYRSLILEFFRQNNVLIYKFITKKVYGDLVDLHKKQVRAKKLDTYLTELRKMNPKATIYKTTNYLFNIDYVGFEEKNIFIKIDYEDRLTIEVKLEDKIIFKASTKVKDNTYIKMKNAIMYADTLKTNSNVLELKENFNRIFEGKLIFFDYIY